MEKTHKAPIDSAVDAAQKAIDEVVKEDASKTEAENTADVQGRADQPEFKSHGESKPGSCEHHPHESRGACCGGDRGRHCRVGKWLTIFALMLASGIIGGLIGGKIGGHGGHERMSRHGGMMMQQDGMRGGMHGPMRQGMGQGMGQGMQQGAPMAQPDAGQQPNPQAPANPAQAAPTR